MKIEIEKTTIEKWIELLKASGKNTKKQVADEMQNLVNDLGKYEDIKLEDLDYRANDLFDPKMDDYKELTKHLVRPYIYISRDLYYEIFEIANEMQFDFVYYKGKKYTFGDADGEKALMLWRD